MAGCSPYKSLLIEYVDALNIRVSALGYVLGALQELEKLRGLVVSQLILKYFSQSLILQFPANKLALGAPGENSCPGGSHTANNSISMALFNPYDSQIMPKINESLLCARNHVFSPYKAHLKKSYLLGLFSRCLSQLQEPATFVN